MPTRHPPVTHLLYLHGFRSSPRSVKAQKVAARVAQRHPHLVWWCPQLAVSPAEAAKHILQGTADWPRDGMAVIGSSLGGFYATWLAASTGCRAVLLNPAVHPARDLARHIGAHAAWHDPAERLHFQPAHVGELTALDHATPPHPHPERVLAVIAQGDEVLDWREMAARHANAQQWVLPGSDHALSDFDHLIDGVFDFLGLA